MASNEFLERVQNLCKEVRKEHLRYTYRDMEKLTGVKWGNFSAWESGRANKIEYLYYYLIICDAFTKKYFLNELSNICKGVK